MSTLFGQLIKKHRTQSNQPKLSQQKLADAIGKTKQYINLLENGSDGTQAPNIELCLALAKKLSLSDQETEDLLYTAFKSRIKNNWELFEYLLDKGRFGDIQKKASVQILESTDRLQSLKGQTCYYYLSWRLNEVYESFWDQLGPFSVSVIDTLIQDIGHSIHKIKFEQNALHMVLSLGIDQSIKDMITGVQQLSSAAIKSHFSDLPLRTSPIWDSDLMIHTLSDPEQVDFL